MDPSDGYPDLLGDALSRSSQRLAQLGSLVASGAVVEARRRALRNAAEAARDRQALDALREQERAAAQLARAGWVPAHDQRWLAEADLLQTARTWSAATSYADADPAAASAARKCEERLRTLHPYAMARYDRLREEGAGPFGAMGETAPLFAREPHARPGQPAPERGILAAPASQQPTANDGRTADSPPLPDPGLDPAAEAGQRGQQIVRHLQAQARAERGSALSADELVTVLEANTTLPGEVIARLTRAGSEERIAAGAERARAAGLDSAAAAPAMRGGTGRTGHLSAARRDTLAADTASAQAAGSINAAQLAAESFPCTATDAVRAATASPRPGQPLTRTLAAPNIRRPSRSM